MANWCKAIFAVTLAVIFISSGALHNSVHHEHGHSAADTAFWGQLHSVLRHDEKDLVAVSAFAVLALILLSSAILNRFFVMPSSYVAFLHPDRGTYLRRGVARYRCFG